MSNENHTTTVTENKKYKPPKQYQSYHKEAVKSFSDEEIALLVDNFIDIWDTDKDGFITYYEYRTMSGLNQMDSEDDDGNDIESKNHHN